MTCAKPVARLQPSAEDAIERKQREVLRLVDGQHLRGVKISRDGERIPAGVNRAVDEWGLPLQSGGV